MKTCFWLPRAAQEPPKDAQEAAKTAQERPGAAQGRPKRGPRAAKSDPGSRTERPESAQETPRTAQEKPMTAQEPAKNRPGRPKRDQDPSKGDDRRKPKPRYTVPQTDQKSFRTHEGRGHFTHRQLAFRAFNARVHSSIYIYICF